MLGVGEWLVEGVKMDLIRIGFVTDFYGSMLTLKSETFEVIEGFCVRCWGLGFGVGGGVFSDLLGVRIDNKKEDM